jgi:hypothetical protein
MGYMLTPIAVNLTQVAKVMGSRDARLIDALVEEFGDDFDQIDDMAADYDDEESAEEPLTVHAALTQMVMGEKCDKALGFVYGYTLEFICRHFGEYLPNDEWSSMPRGTQWAETVDQALQAAGVPKQALRVGHHLMGRGAPVAIPEPDDFPGIGYLRLDEIRAAQKALTEANVAAIEDAEVRAAIQQLQAWMQACADSQRDLICFYA